MSILIAISLALFCLLVLGHYYSKYLAQKLGLDDNNKTPAFTQKDNSDYIPTRTPIVFAHHFATIAGAGPIVGPTLALAFGWGLPYLWIIIGCILFGAVHDMTSMFVSMREKGRSIAEMTRLTLGNTGYFLFVTFLLVILTLINAIFLNLSAKALTAAYPAELLKLTKDNAIINTYTNAQGILMGRIGGIATTSVLVITLLAPLIGWLQHKKNCSLFLLYFLSIIICILGLVLGFKYPIMFQSNSWLYIMAGYTFIACWLPVWVILQPRDFVNVQILYAGIVIMFIGLIFYGVSGHSIEMNMFDISQGSQITSSPVWPFLFITVACGAISGFHSLASTGTTVKQITKESEVVRIGYRAMVLEGFLAILSLLLVASALPRSEYLNIVFPAGADGNPILAFSISMGYMLNDVLGIRISIGAVIGILVLEGFVITTLDTAIRLCRYILEEFWIFLFEERTPRLLKNPFFNTAVAIILMLSFALNSTIMSAWTIFGAGNQLIASSSLLVVSVWLLQRKKTAVYTLIPAIIMIVTTFASLFLSLTKYWFSTVDEMLVKSSTIPLLVANVLLLALAICMLFLAIKVIFSLVINNRQVKPVK